ncbi:uncharacterized protein LOC143434846 [Arvicanthis niloticus]|uniref:uncharacterized protein LOC143309157 n=1 Tax=Arvicanthis niloticus TaxID=61156 RepID=UPI00402B83DC
MGQTHGGVVTPLSLFLDHFKDYKIRARNRNLVVKKKRLTAFCRKEWPTFNVGWPPEGTYYLPVILRTKDIIFGRPGHPGQVPYIITWLDLVQDPPEWLKPWVPKPRAAILAPENSEKRKTETNPMAPLYPVLQGGTEEDLFSYPPYRLPPGGHPGPQPKAPRGVQGPLLVIPPHTQEKVQKELPSHPGPQPEFPGGAQGLPLVIPPDTQEQVQQELPSHPGPQPEVPGGAQGPPLVIPPDTQEQVQQELPSHPGLQPEAPEEAQGLPLVSPLHTQEKAQQELPRLPAAESLRATGPQDDEGNQLMVPYCPLAVRELYNWKCKYPQFSEKPAALINLLDSVFLTHQPTWDDCQLLLRVLFTTEEREKILIEAIKLVPGVNGSPTTKQALIDAGFYSIRPDWDFNSAEGKESLRVYHQTLMRGLRAAAQGPSHLAKVCSVHQEKAESPAAFLERIMEAYRTYTSLDPEAPENKSAVIMTFVNQAFPDIKHKLQRIDRLGEKSLQELLVVAEKVTDNREILKKKQLQAPKELQNQRLAMICAALSADSPEERHRQLRRCLDGKALIQKQLCPCLKAPLLPS